MSQLNIYIYIYQISWLIIIFTVYYIIMKYNIISRIMATIKIKRRIIKG